MRVEALRRVAVEEAGRAAQQRLREEDNRREAESLGALSHQTEQLRIEETEQIVNTERVNEERSSTRQSGERLLIPPPLPSRAELDYLREKFNAQIAGLEQKKRARLSLLSSSSLLPISNRALETRFPFNQSGFQSGLGLSNTRPTQSIKSRRERERRKKEVEKEGGKYVRCYD